MKIIVFQGFFCALAVLLAGFFCALAVLLAARAASAGEYDLMIFDLVFMLWIATKLVGEIDGYRDRRRRARMVRDMKGKGR